MTGSRGRIVPHCRLSCNVFAVSPAYVPEHSASRDAAPGRRLPNPAARRNTPFRTDSLGRSDRMLSQLWTGWTGPRQERQERCKRPDDPCRKQQTAEQKKAFHRLYSLSILPESLYANRPIRCGQSRLSGFPDRSAEEPPKRCQVYFRCAVGPRK